MYVVWYLLWNENVMEHNYVSFIYEIYIHYAECMYNFIFEFFHNF